MGFQDDKKRYNDYIKGDNVHYLDLTQTDDKKAVLKDILLPDKDKKPEENKNLQEHTSKNTNEMILTIDSFKKVLEKMKFEDVSTGQIEVCKGLLFEIERLYKRQ